MSHSHSDKDLKMNENLNLNFDLNASLTAVLPEIWQNKLLTYSAAS